MAATRWNVVVSTSTDVNLRQFLAAQGGGRKGDLSRFVEEAVQAHILELSTKQAKRKNAHETAAALDEAVDSALAWARRS